MDARTQENKLYWHIIRMFVFGLFLALPSIDSLLHVDRSPLLREQRLLADKPDFVMNEDALTQFPEKYEAYYNDHLGFRKMLIRLNGLIKYRLLNISTSPRVIVGKDGWLLFNDLDAVRDYQGIAPFTDEELRHYRDVLEGRSAWLAQRGIKYLFVVAPNQITVYPEYLPDYFKRTDNGTHLDNLLAYMNKESDIKILDLRRPLMEAKEKYPVYFKQGSHWNDYGAFVAYRSIIQRLSEHFPGLRPRELSDYKVDFWKDDDINYFVKNAWFKFRSGDIGGYDCACLGMLGLKDVDFEEGNSLRVCYNDHDNMRLSPLRPTTVEDAPLDLGAEEEFWLSQPQDQRPVAKRNANSTLRALVFRDSFAKWLVSFLSEHFNRSVYLWSSADYDRLKFWVEREHPDVVIDVVCERFLRMRPEDNPEFRKAAAKAQTTGGGTDSRLSAKANPKGEATDGH